MQAVWQICERVAEAQAVLEDHVAGGKHTSEDVVKRLHTLFGEDELLRAMHAVGYFPPRTLPPGRADA